MTCTKRAIKTKTEADLVTLRHEARSYLCPHCNKYHLTSQFKEIRNDSTSAGGWEAIEDSARLKISIDYTTYFVASMIEYLKTQPYPLSHPNPHIKEIKKG